MAGALEEGKITPKTTYIDKGIVKIGGYTIYNYGKKVWGKRTMTEVLEKSINTGAVFVERKLGNNLFLKYIENFGFFEKTGIDLPEIYSENKEFKKGYEINFATASFGQGIEITPIQLVRAYCAIANGGRLVTPYLNSDKKPELSKPVISSKTASQLATMLVSVVDNGFAKPAHIPGYYIAGKTGTSQVPFTSLGIKKRGYSEKTWQTFIGFFPAFDPQFLILVKLDNPKTKNSEYSAVPIFHDLAEYIINYYQIPPDYEI
jgi:cell division protein FtsI (penicillin-binding protein 3)/stage V sporulation protein D (sporulation-specific penicillin-binding protein)